MYTQFPKLLPALALSLAFATSGALANDMDSKAVAEARQETQIWTTYALSPYLRAHDLKVSVSDGKATLTGKVDESVNKDLAKQIALGVDGIKDVDNQIVVQSDYVSPARTAGRSYGDSIDDASISTAIKSKLMWSKHADGLTANVDTKAGKVTLSGSAHSADAKEFAGTLAKNTRGVTSVDNRLSVTSGKATADSAKAQGSDRSAGDKIADGWITTKVKSTYATSKNVDGSDISVSTDGGVVTLSGNVDSGAARALAIELAKNVRGVKSVQSKGLTTS